MAKLEFLHLSKVYNDQKGQLVKAVTDFNLEVKDKEFIVIVGPSGCGKSTVLRMIAGLEKITAGELFIGDKYVNNLEPKDRNIAMVFQNYALYPNMTVADNISYGLRMNNVKKEIIRKKVKEVSEILNLEAYLDRKPNQLSGGQRQRVALGRAMVRDPDCFLLDEPLSNLDAKLRTRMRQELAKLHKKIDTTFIYVTHDQTEAMTLGDRIVVIKEGIIQQIGTPSELYHHPQNHFVASFIGMPIMNFFHGKMLKKDNDYFVQTELPKFTLNDNHKYHLVDTYQESTDIILGIRAERISVGNNNFKHAIRIKAEVINVEYYGTYNLYHLLFNGVYFTGRGTPDLELKQNSSVEVYFNTDKIHLFDNDTKETLLSQIPAKKIIKSQIDSTKKTLNIVNTEIGIDDSLLNILIDKQLTDQDIYLEIPIDAYTVYNENVKNAIQVEALVTEIINNVATTRFKLLDQVFVLYGKYEGTKYLQLDLSKVLFTHNEERFSLPPTYRLKGRYLKEKNGKTSVKHYIKIGDVLIETYYSFNRRMYLQGGNIFKYDLTFEIDRESLRIAVEKEVYPTFSTTVLKLIEYSDVQYIIIELGGQEIAIKGTAKVGEEVKIAIDLDYLHVYNNIIQLF